MRRIPVLQSHETSVINGPQLPVILITYSRQTWQLSMYGTVTEIWALLGFYAPQNDSSCDVSGQPIGPETSVTTTRNSVTSQKRSDLIYTAAEAWTKALWCSPAQCKSNYTKIMANRMNSQKIKKKTFAAQKKILQPSDFRKHDLFDSANISSESFKKISRPWWYPKAYYQSAPIPLLLRSFYYHPAIYFYVLKRSLSFGFYSQTPTRISILFHACHMLRSSYPLKLLSNYLRRVT